jgi:sulfofructose kinase
MTTILVAGVAVIDFVFSLDAMPRRADKFRARDAAIVGGGCAANAAVTVARLGGTARLAANVGQDEIGDMIVRGLAAEGVDCGLVRRHEGRRSSFSSVFVDSAGERQIVNFRDEGLYRDTAWLAEWIPASFDAALADTRWAGGAAAVLEAARARKRPGVLDADLIDHDVAEALAAASHIAFSARGLRDYAGMDDLSSALRKARERSGAWLCCTDGNKGVIFLDDGDVRRVPAFVVEAVDTLGAGDVWHGAFALALGEGKPEAEAILFANAVAALKCTRFGGRGGIPDRTETEAFMRRNR